MIKKLMKKSGIKTNIKRKYARGQLTEKLCATILNGYKPGAKTYNYGDCFSTRTYDVSAGGMCISHPDRLLAGKYIMVNSRNSLKKVECINCAMVGIISQEFASKAIIAKVIWATENRCGIEYVDIFEPDKRKMDRLAKTSFGEKQAK